MKGVSYEEETKATYTYGVLGYIKEQLPKGGVEMGWVLTHGMMVCCIKYTISPRKTGKVAPEAENRSHPVTPLNQCIFTKENSPGATCFKGPFQGVLPLDSQSSFPVNAPCKAL